MEDNTCTIRVDKNPVSCDELGIKQYILICEKKTFNTLTFPVYKTVTEQK